MKNKISLGKLSYLAFSLFLAFQISGCGNKETVTAEDYERAESFLRGNTASLVSNTVSGITWLKDERILYNNSIGSGQEFIIADLKTTSKTHAFDHQKLADTLSELTGDTLTATTLPFRSFSFNEDETEITFTSAGSEYTCSLADYTCTSTKAKRNQNPFFSGEVASPDGQKIAFIRDYNLYMRDAGTGKVTQLTFDGKEHYGYATNNAGWTKRNGPVLLWSPDSKRIATFRHDSRGTGDMYLVSTNVGHPELESWKYPLPGDSLIFRIERVVINLEPTPKLVRLKMDPDPHRSTITDHIAGRGGLFLDVEWSDDSKSLSFVSSSRDHKTATFRTANPNTGSVKTILSETEETFFESGNRLTNWHYLPETNEIIWFSERSDWGHLYLYDLTTGKLKHQITSGNWAVQQVLHIDKNARKIYFIGSNREPGDPYFNYLYSINFDGEDLTLLTPDNANHSITFSDDYTYFVDTYSTPTTPPVSVVRTMDGEQVMELEKADISALLATGWQPPVPFTVKARDGETDLYGLMYKPTNFSASKSYPILNYLYPGPQSGSVGSRSFSASRSDKQSLAELGFIVVEVDAMGTPGRSKSFHEFYYGNMGDNGIPDQIATIQQLATENSWMDIDRVGIFGHSGGGFASTRAILAYPDFYKVAVSGAGNHDNRNYEDDWGEKWQGLLKSENFDGENTDFTTNYDNQANQLLAANLKGKLLITHGTMDSNVPPYNTLLVVNALIEANKDFDLILFPNRGHGYYSEPYMMRRRWDYFVRWLKDTEPPKEFTFGED